VSRSERQHLWEEITTYSLIRNRCNTEVTRSLERVTRSPERSKTRNPHLAKKMLEDANNVTKSQSRDLKSMSRDVCSMHSGNQRWKEYSQRNRKE
jgi:hypothetical protein